MIFCFYTTFTQSSCFHQHIWMAWYLDRYIIVNITNNVLNIWPISKNDFISSILYCRSYILFIIVKFKSAIFFNCFWVKIKIYCTFATIPGFMFYHKKFFTVKFITISLASFLFLLPDRDVCLRI